MVLDERGRPILEFDRSAGSRVRDLIVALRSELSPVHGRKAALAFLGEELDPESLIDDLARRSQVGEGGRISLTLLENHIPGRGDPLADTEVVEAVQTDRPPSEAQRQAMAEESTQVIRRPILPRLEERRGTSPSAPDIKTELIRRADARARDDDTPIVPYERPAHPAVPAELEETAVDDESSPARVRSVVLTVPRRMRRGGTFPIRVVWNSNGKGAPIEVSPRLPGCLVTPHEDRLAGGAGSAVEFWVTPLISGMIRSPTILYRQDATEIGRTSLQIEVVDRRRIVAAVLFGLVAPWLGLAGDLTGFREWVTPLEIVGWALALASFAMATALYARSFPVEEEKTTFLAP